MLTTESDISWQLLRQIVQEWAGSAAELEQVVPLHGGCVNTTMHLSLTTGEQVVLKISPHRVNHSYLDEEHQLAMLRNLGIPVPDVYACVIGTLDFPHSYMLMEFVDGKDWSKARSHCTADEADHLQQELAELVARLHDVTGEAFGRVTYADHTGAGTWPEFYRELYDSIFKSVESSPLVPVKARRRLAKIHNRLPQLLNHDDPPRLVHWDLWSGNLLAKPNGDGRWHVAAVLDPSCKFAHAEAELAYLELFQTTTPAFLKAYQNRHRLPPEYHRIRKPLYQMYELMNHVQLFGTEYVKPMCVALDRVMA
ncbi:fructosamine kinase family protein [soil metagenome]